MTERSITGSTAPPSRFERGLSGFLHAATIDEAAARRARQDGSRTRLVHESSLVTLLAGLADRHITVRIDCAHGPQLTGLITAVGRDFVAFHAVQHWLLRTAAVAAVTVPTHTPSRHPLATPARLDRTFGEVLHEIEGQDVIVRGQEGALATGRLLGCGRDYVRVETPPGRRSTYVNIEAAWAIGVEAQLWGSAS